MAINARHADGPTAGRHRRPRRRAALVAAMLSAVAVTGAGAAAFAGDDGQRPPGCAGDRPLEVVSAPELVPALETLTEAVPCVRVNVTAAEPGDVAAQVASGTAPADVWIPDSSRWVTGGRGPRGGDPFPSIARSPVVLAVPASVARRLGPTASFEGVARAATTPARLSLTVEDPSLSAPAQAAVVGLAEALSSTPTSRGHLAALLRGAVVERRSGSRTPTDPPGHRSPAARVTTEQAVWSVNTSAGRVMQRAVYATGTGRAMDYPYVVTTEDPAVRRRAQRLLSTLTNAAGRAVLERLGFRTPAGDATAQLSRATGVDPRATAATALTRADSRAALGLLATLARPSRVLALVDVSGSMAQVVPGTPAATRIELARDAIRGAMRLFPAGTVAGLWRFSSDLTPSTNYEQLVPLARLTAGSRRALAAAVEGLDAVPNGGTGLYDSILAAVRYVRAGFDPDRVNSVVVLSDGRNEFASAHGITMRALLDALRADADPRRPVVVISVAYGPDSDTTSLRAISEATGGTLYTAEDPRDLDVIFRDAIGQRLCGDGC